MASAAHSGHDRAMHSQNEGVHHPLCTIQLMAERHAERCTGADCAFWENGCALARIEVELGGRPEVARLLLDLRREIESSRTIALHEARAALAALPGGA